MRQRGIPFVRGGLQWRYLRLVLIAMLTPTILVGACLYYVTLRIVAEEIAFPEAIISTLLPAIHRINMLLVVVLPIVLFFLFLWGLVLSHRFAGPIFRLERELERIGQGDFSQRVHFRRKDELKSVAERLNRVLDTVEKLTKQARS